jgi:hypothetical protein
MARPKGFRDSAESLWSKVSNQDALPAQVAGRAFFLCWSRELGGLLLLALAEV